MRLSLGALLLVSSAATFLASCEGEPLPDGSTESIVAAKGIHIDHIPTNNSTREGVLLIAVSADPEYSDRILLRSSLAPGEALQLSLHNTATGEFRFQDVEFTFSDESVVGHLGNGLIVGVADGEAVACGRYWDQESCIVLAVGGGMLSQYWSSESGASTSVTLMSLDGVPAMNGSTPLLQVAGAYMSQYTAVSPDGRYMADLVNMKLRCFEPSWEMALPEPPVQGWQGWYFYSLYSNGGKVTVVANGMDSVYLAQVLSDGTKVCPMKPLADVGEGGSVALLALSPDGSQALARVKLDAASAPVTWLIDLPGMKGKPFAGDLAGAGSVSYSNDSRFLVAAGSAESLRPGQERTLTVYSSESGEWKELYQVSVPVGGETRCSQDGTFAYMDDGTAAVVLLLETGDVALLPSGGTLTPWNTLHYWIPPAGSRAEEGIVSDASDAYEYVPILGTAVPTRIYLPLGVPSPSGRAYSLASLFSPIAAATDLAESWQGLDWVSARPMSLDPPRLLDAAKDPGAFLAVLAPLPNIPSNSLSLPRSGLELLDLGGGKSRWLSAGNEDIASFDVSHAGLVFMVTAPYGYLVVSDTGMHRYSILAIGVTGPVAASADGQRVAVWAPEGTARVYEVTTGEELLSYPGATTVCLPPDSGDIYLADVNGEGIRLLADGTSQHLYAGVDSPSPDHKVGYSWSDDCRRMVVSGDGWASLFEEGNDGQTTISAQGASLATLSRDGKALALVGKHTETVDQFDGELIEHMDMIDLYVAKAPKWKPKRLVTWAAYAGGYSSGVTYSFERPAVWPNGELVAVPFSETAVSTGWSDRGAWQTISRNSRLLFVDSTGGITNKGPMSSDPKYVVEGSDVLRIR